VALAVAAVILCTFCWEPREIGGAAPSPVAREVRLLADTVLAMGGALNSYGLLMDLELHGYVSGAPGTYYEGYEFRTVPWAAGVFSFLGSKTWDESQIDGVQALDTVINQSDPGSKLVAFGHSASAAVLTKELRALQARRDEGLPTPSPDDLSFVVIGSTNRPNGGLMSRLAGLSLPLPFGWTFDGPATETDYHVLDISWEYDPMSDLPTHPFNLLADLNALVAMLTRHSFYYDADPTDPTQVLSDVTSGNTRYLTLKREHLPILEPFYLLGVLNPLLDAVEPALRYVIDLAYDRTVSPAVAKPFQWSPINRDPKAVAAGFAAAVAGGDVSVPDPISGAPSPTSSAADRVVKANSDENRRAAASKGVSRRPGSTGHQHSGRGNPRDATARNEGAAGSVVGRPSETDAAGES
jgi:hypothetical protein